LHEEVNCDAVEYAGCQRALNQERHVAAGEIINARGPESDQEMERYTEHGGVHAALKRFRAEDSAGYALKRADYFAAEEQSDGNRA